MTQMLLTMGLFVVPALPFILCWWNQAGRRADAEHRRLWAKIEPRPCVPVRSGRGPGTTADSRVHGEDRVDGGTR